MNHNETTFYQNTIGMGFQTFHSGLPDFLLIVGNKILYVEIKSSENTQIPYRQYIALKALHDAGIIVGICFDGDINSIFRFNPKFKRNLQLYLIEKNLPKISLGQIMGLYHKEKELALPIKEQSFERKLETLADKKGKKPEELTAEEIFPVKQDLS